MTAALEEDELSALRLKVTPTLIVDSAVLETVLPFPLLLELPLPFPLPFPHLLRRSLFYYPLASS